MPPNFFEGPVFIVFPGPLFFNHIFCFFFVSWVTLVQLHILDIKETLIGFILLTITPVLSSALKDVPNTVLVWKYIFPNN